MKKNSIIVPLQIDMSELDQTIEKINELLTLLEEAMNIAKSIASLQLDLQINAVINDKPTELARITTE